MIALILGLALVGFLLWVIDQKIPMDPTIKTAIRVVVLVLVVIYLWRLFDLPDLPLPRYR